MAEALAGKIALVTGGLSGIGAAVAALFAASGARVIAADITAAAGPIGEDAVAPARLDVADAGSCAALVDAIKARFGRLDILVNSAGIGADLSFLDTPVDVFDRVYAVNLRGTFLIGQAAARLMCEGAGGSIVNLSSVSGMRGNLGRAAYGASKAGVVVLSQVMAVELASRGIRVNVISPGPIETPLVAVVHDQAIRDAWGRFVPMGRYGQPSEIAAAALFLASDAASYITGQVLAVDGGFIGGGLVSK